jgi:sugar diacid utilization regulator
VPGDELKAHAAAIRQAGKPWAEPPHFGKRSCTFSAVVEDAMTRLAGRLRLQEEEQARSIVERYREEIVDYAASDPEFVDTDVLNVTRRCLSDLLDNIAESASSPTPQQLQALQELFARRPHQGVALPSIQHAFRLFGEEVFAALADCASPEDPDELQAVIRSGAIIMRFAHELISVVTQTYLDELEDVSRDREIVSRSLLDAVLAGRASSASSLRDARILGIDLLDQTVVIVARAPVSDDDTEGECEDHRPRTLRRAAKLLRESVLHHSEAGRALVGVREGAVVCLCPAPAPEDAERATQAAHVAAAELDGLGMSVGVGHWCKQAGEIPASYSEAREAAVFAMRSGERGRAVVYDDVLVDHLLRANENAGRVIAAALDPLRDYDDARNASLVETLRAYVEANFSITGAARAMHVHNNTILYRLDRIRRLTGRDPRNPRDIVFLALSLRLDAQPVG